MPRVKCLLITTAMFFAGCVGTDFINEPATTMPVRVAINPISAAVEAGKTTSLQAAYYDSLGNAVAGVTFQWISSDPNIAAVEANGLVSGKQVGQAQISAKARGVTSAPAILTVVADANQVARVIVTPDSGQITVGGMLQFTAVARNLIGDVLNGKTFSWRSADATIATIDNNGLVTGLKVL